MQNQKFLANKLFCNYFALPTGTITTANIKCVTKFKQGYIVVK